MKPIRIFLAALALGVALFFAWINRLPPFSGKPSTTAVSVAEVSADMLAVSVHGTAHYPLRISQPRPKTLTQPARVWWLFPLLPPDDTSGRSVRVLVASTVEPDPIVSYEDMTVEGWALSGEETVNQELRDAFQAEGYTFEREVVLIERFPD